MVSSITTQQKLFYTFYDWILGILIFIDSIFFIFLAWKKLSGYPNLMKIVAYQKKPRFVYAVKILSRYFTTESSLAHFCAIQSGFIYAELQFISMQKKFKT